MKPYTSYLFDADGTLFDTVDLICTCFEYIVEKYAGKAMDRSTIINSIGLPLESLIVAHIGPDIEQDQIIYDYYQYQLNTMEDNISTFPLVIETLETLKSAGKKLAIVTSRTRFSLEKILHSTGTEKYFDVLVTPEDTTRHKPNAEPVLKAISLLGADKTSTVFTGDALYDICSGISAGIDTIFVNWSRVERSSLTVSPSWMIDSLHELSACLNTR